MRAGDNTDSVLNGAFVAGAACVFLLLAPVVVLGLVSLWGVAIQVVSDVLGMCVRP